MNDELSLLCECISTEGESEAGGVKFIWMDENTIYRFENNRMKKIGKQLINKAKREITRRQTIQSNNDNDESTPQPAKTRSKRKTHRDAQLRQSSKAIKQPKREMIPDSDSDDDNAIQQIEEEDVDEVEPQPVKPTRTKSVKPTRTEPTKATTLTQSIDLDEYYDTKHRMEYMTLEINRLNSKVGKLKQYKSIVNKLTGGEIDDLPQSQQQQQQQITRSERPERVKNNNANDSLFMF